MMNICFGQCRVHLGTMHHIRTILRSRFLRARQYDFKASKLMLKNCEDWRGSVGGKGMSDLYKEIDPFDVSDHGYNYVYALSHLHISIRSETPSLSIGLCSFTR
jgi:hypothetical protein